MNADSLEKIEKTARGMAAEYRRQADRESLRIGAETHAQYIAANDLDEIADRLAALPMAEWRDISTAPKDGTTVLLLIPGFQASTGYWDREYHAWSSRTQEEDYDSENGKSDYFDESDYQPTLWLPLSFLPPPPAKESTP